MTAAEAQAFKRAASCFGLGRYLYNFAEMWVPLNEYRQPVEFPKLPQWALPKAGSAGRSHPAAGPRPAAIQRGPIDQKTTVRIEGFRQILGNPIYGEILWRAAHARRANEIPNAQLQTDVAEAMERAARGFHKVQSLAEEIGETAFITVMDRLRIESMTAIPRLETLKTSWASLNMRRPGSPHDRMHASYFPPAGGSMRNVLMIRKEPGLVSIPVETAVYCETTVSDLRRMGRKGWRKLCPGPAYFIVSRETGKLSYFWKHAYNTPKSGKARQCVTNPDRDNARHDGSYEALFLQASFAR